MTSRELLDLATQYHQALPGRVRKYLNDRGIPDLQIDAHLLGWNGQRISIPIFDRSGELVSFKLARDAEDPFPGSKMITTPGAHAELYGWDELLRKPPQIVICEGEFDRLVLEANGFSAVTSTGGAGVFRPEWVADFEPIAEVYACFDNDTAGRSGAERVSRLIPRARIIELPEEVGWCGDVTDYFVRLKHTREEFAELMDAALPMPPSPEPERSAVPRAPSLDSQPRSSIDRIKQNAPIAEVVGRYVKLQNLSHSLVGLCPFHEDHHPSLAVFPVTGTFHCFGCRKHGDVITFVREIEHLSFHEALSRLEDICSQPR